MTRIPIPRTERRMRNVAAAFAVLVLVGYGALWRACGVTAVLVPIGVGVMVGLGVARWMIAGGEQGGGE